MANFFVSKDAITEATARIDGEEARHIAQVLRMKVGDAVTLCDGEGMCYDATLCAFDKTTVTADIVRAYPSEAEPHVQVTLYQAIPKSDKLEWIVQKVTELGAVRIVPVNTARIVAKIEKEAKLLRLRKIAAEAAKQSRRGAVPIVASPLTLREALAEMQQCDVAIVPYEDERGCDIQTALRGVQAQSVAILIGPEGGFAPEEIEAAVAAGVRPVTLGPRILRTETAGIATVAIALYECGEMR